LVTVISWAGAAAIFAAAVVYGLLEQRITVDEPPSWVGDSSPDSVEANLEDHYAWFATTLGQEQIAAGLLLTGLLAAAVVVLLVAARLPSSPLRQLWLITAMAGLAGWAWAEIAVIGAYRAVEQMAASGNPIETVNAVAFTADTQAGYTQGIASLALGVGLVLLGPAAGWSQPRAWVALTVVVGALLLLLGAVKVAEQDELWIQVAVGAIALPAWLVASGHIVNRTETTEGSSDEESSSYATRG